MATPPFDVDVDVLVLGGGLSGLAAADAVLTGGRTCALLEAAPVLGGRTSSVPLACCPDARVDEGGQWLGPRQTAALALASRLGLPLQPQHTRGRRVLQLGAAVRTYTGLIPAVSWAVLLDAQAVILLTRLLGWAVLAAPLLPRALVARLAAWADATTVAQLAGAAMWTAGGRSLLRVVVQALFGAEPGAVSLLAFMRYVHASGGSLEEMTDVGPRSLQAWTVVGGAAQLSAGLAASVEAAGGRVRTGCAAVEVRRLPRGGGVEVVCADGTRARARQLVVALPPPAVARLAFHPPLPPARAAWLAEAAMGCIIKAHVVYSAPFWRDAGFSGEVVCDTDSDPGRGPAFNVFDACVRVPPTAECAGVEAWAWERDAGGAAGAPPPPPHKLLPCLAVFINGDRAREWGAAGADARRAAVVAQLGRWFGPQALAPLEYRDCDWGAAPWTRGCPIASYGRGVLGRLGLRASLAEPCWGGRADGDGAPEDAVAAAVAPPCLHWAGTETATVSTGFMDGALRAGARAAAAVQQALAEEDAGEEGARGRAHKLAALPDGVDAQAAASPLQRALLHGA